VQILEIGEDGEYQSVEVVQGGTLDQGAYQLHQGLQRRIVLSLTHSSGDTLPWEEVTRFRAGHVALLDANGKLSDVDSSQADVPLPLVSPAVIRNNPDGTIHVKLIGQWDSSAHSSILLDRPTVDKYRVQLSLKWEVSSPRATQPMKFAFDVAVQTRPRTWFRQNSLLAQLWHNQRVVHSTASNYSVVLKPTAAKRAGDLWRMDTTGDYISGEELLSGWAPRGVSLIRDFLNARKKQRRVAEIEAARGLFSLSALSPPVKPATSGNDALTEREQALMQRILDLWHTGPSASEIMLLRSNTESPAQGAAFANDVRPGAAHRVPLAATVEVHTKTPAVLKGGWLLSPDPSGTRWIRRYVELRRPYLHMYSNEGDEINAINLTNSRIDAEPQVASLLQRDNVRLEVWAVYATNKAWLFACRNDRERGEWIWAVDRSYVSNGGSSGGRTSPEEEEDDEL